MDKYNIGPQEWPKWIRRLLSLREFNAAGKIHDIMYSENTKVSKKEADRIFKDMMYESIKEHPSRGKRIWLSAVAKVYYIMVVKFGHKAYKGNVK